MLFKKWRQLSIDRLHRFEGINLVEPLVQLAQVGWDGTLVHGEDLLEFAVDNDVNDGKLGSRQILILLQLLVELHNDLLFELVQPELQTLLHLRVILPGRFVRLEDAHDQASDELAGVSAHLSVEVS